MNTGGIQKPEPRPGGLYFPALLTLLALLLGLYTLLRYGGYWGETDTNILTGLIRGVLAEGRLVPESGAYANGYGYPALATALAALTGLPLAWLQLGGGLLLAAWLVVPAWLAYREFTRSPQAASLAVLILLAQPEFLFPLLRGTHEKFTRGLMFACLYLLLRGLRARRTRQVLGCALGFYLAGYALITFNNLMATSFITAIALAVLLLWGMGHFSQTAPAGRFASGGRLGYVVLSLLLLAFMFSFYAYPPAQSQLLVLQSIGERLVRLFLQVDEASADPYATIRLGWVSRPVYYLLSLGNWLLLAGSFLHWLAQGRRWLRRRETPGQAEQLLWAFYAAFAFLGAVSILVDLSGSLGTNLQLRVYASFTMLAAPLAADWVVKHSQPAGRPGLRPGQAALALGLGALLLLAMLKATLEPLLSNYWNFYTPQEAQSIAWAEHKLAGRSLWVGLNQRLTAANSSLRESRQPELVLDAILPEPETANYLVSPAGLLQSERAGVALPVPPDGLLVYDNGGAKIYHRRPLTPFQK